MKVSVSFTLWKSGVDPPLLVEVVSLNRGLSSRCIGFVLTHTLLALYTLIRLVISEVKVRLTFLISTLWSLRYRYHLSLLTVTDSPLCKLSKSDSFSDSPYPRDLMYSRNSP